MRGRSVGEALTRELVGYRHAGVSFDAWLEPPRPEVTLMITLGGAITADGTPLPAAWIGGLSDRPTIVGVGATFEAIDLKLAPPHACALLGTGLSELGGECVGLRDACSRAPAALRGGAVRAGSSATASEPYRPGAPGVLICPRRPRRPGVGSDHWLPRT